MMSTRALANLETQSDGVELHDGWTVVRDAVVRLAGFPFAQLSRLAAPGAAREARRYLEAHAAALAAHATAYQSLLAVPLAEERAARQAQRDFQRWFFKRSPSTLRAQWEAAGHATRPAPEPPPLPATLPAHVREEIDLAQAAIAALEQAWAAASDRAAAELVEARRALRELVAQPRVRGAILLLSPQALAGIDALKEAASGSKQRARERAAVMFLQRLFAKNETHSYFGPTAPVRVSPQDTLSARLDSFVPATRVVRLSHWAAVELCQVAARLEALKPHRRVRRNPSASLSDEVVEWDLATKSATDAWSFSVTRKRARLEPEPLKILAAAEDRSLSEIAERTGLSVDDVAEWIDLLASSGLVEVGFLPGSGAIEPLGVLDEVLARCADDSQVAGFRASLGRLRDEVQSFANADPDARPALLDSLGRDYQALTGSSPTRNAGQLYADRALISEDCRADCAELALPERLLRDHARALAAISALSTLRLEARRADVRSWFQARFGEGRPVRFAEVERAAEKEHLLDKPAGDSEPSRVLRRLADHLASKVAPGPGVVELSADELLARAELAPSGGFYFPVDLLLAAGASGPTLVVGEVQYGFILAHDFMVETFFPEERARFRRSAEAMIRELAQGLPVAEGVQPHGGKTDLRRPLFDYELLVDVQGARSQLPEERVIHLADVTVTLREGRFHFSSPRVEAFIPVMRLGCHALLQAMAPIAAGMAYPDAFPPPGLFSQEVLDDSPRIVIDGVVARRRTRVVRREEVVDALSKQGAALLVDAEALRSRLGMPRHAFVKVEGERKPVLFDPESPLLLEALRHLVEAAAAGARITFSEMLPGPSELVVEGPEGAHTSELRTCFYRRGPGR